MRSHAIEPRRVVAELVESQAVRLFWDGCGTARLRHAAAAEDSVGVVAGGLQTKASFILVLEHPQRVKVVR